MFFKRNKRSDVLAARTDEELASIALDGDGAEEADIDRRTAGKSWAQMWQGPHEDADQWEDFLSGTAEESKESRWLEG